MDYCPSLLDRIPDIESLPSIGDVVISPGGYQVKVTRISQVSDYLVIAGEVFGMFGYFPTTTAWPVRCEVEYA